MAEAVFSMGQISKALALKVRVKGVKTFQLRLRIAMLIMRVAARVAGMPITVDVDAE